MEKNKDGVWLDDILCDTQLTGSEKLWRDINRIADEFYLLVTMYRYPLISEAQQYTVRICRNKNKKWLIIYEAQGMELDVVLRKIKKKLEKYKDDNKEYIIQKAGGGEFI